MADNIKKFFTEFESCWEAIPGYVKVFLYSSFSSVAGLYFAHALTFNGVLAIVLTNLGIYQLPRSVGGEIKRRI